MGTTAENKWISIDAKQGTLGEKTAKRQLLEELNWYIMCSEHRTASIFIV